MQQDLQKFVVNQYNSLHLRLISPKSRWRRGRSRFHRAQKGRHAVSVLIRSSIVSRLFNAVAALSLCGSTAAWAGDGGADQASVNSAWITFCNSTLATLSPPVTCPATGTEAIPTVTQGILQFAASLLVPPVVARSNGSSGVQLAPLGQAFDAIDPSLPPAFIPVPNTNPQGFFLAITKFPIPAKSTTTKPLVLGLSDLLPAMTPLAFISSSKSPAPVTQLSNPSANVFLYGVASGFMDDGGQPDTVFFVYDDPSRTNGNLKQGSVVAEFSFPLVSLTGYGTSTPTETVVPTTLQFRATSAGDCSTSTVSGQGPSGSFSTLASKIGIDCAVVFAPSPLSTASHAIFQVAIPLIVTQATDTLYFSPVNSLLADFFGVYLPYSVTGGPWKTDVTGFLVSSGVTGIPNGSYIGLAPSAQPLLPPGTTSLPAVIPYALCANLPSGNGNGQAPVPGVAAFYAIATDGATLLSAPSPGSSTSTCPF
jgi:hypothetical protein